MKQIQKYAYWPMCGLAEIYLYADESYLALLFAGIFMTTLAGLLDKSCDLRGEIIEIYSENVESEHR